MHLDISNGMALSRAAPVFPNAGGWAAGPVLLGAAGPPPSDGAPGGPPPALFRAAVLTVPSLDAAGGLRHDPTYGSHELGPATAAVAAAAVERSGSSGSSAGSAVAEEQHQQHQLHQQQRGPAADQAAVASWCPYTRLAAAATAASAGAAGPAAPPPHPPAVRNPAPCTAVGATWPALLLRTALYDTNVPYWDPAKALAALRCCDAAAAAAATGAKRVPAASAVTGSLASASASGQHGPPLRVMQVSPEPACKGAVRCMAKVGVTLLAGTLFWGFAPKLSLFKQVEKLASRHWLMDDSRFPGPLSSTAAGQARRP